MSGYDGLVVSTGTHLPQVMSLEELNDDDAKRYDFIALEKEQSNWKSTSSGKRAGKLVAAAAVGFLFSPSHQLVLPGDVIVFPTTDPQLRMRLIKAQTALCRERCVFLLHAKTDGIYEERRVHTTCSLTRNRCFAKQ